MVNTEERVFQLEQDEWIIVGEENLKVYISEYYKNLFGAPAENNVQIYESYNNDLPQLSIEENAILTTDFSEKEVYEAISQIETNKVPRPDG